MDIPNRLLTEEIQRRLVDLPGWSLRDEKLYRDFEFADFAHAFAFMSHMALVSERLHHHPEWTNTYNHVVIRLWTHDVEGVSDLDFSWGKAANRAVAVIGR